MHLLPQCSLNLPICRFWGVEHEGLDVGWFHLGTVEAVAQLGHTPGHGQTRQKPAPGLVHEALLAAMERRNRQVPVFGVLELAHEDVVAAGQNPRRDEGGGLGDEVQPDAVLARIPPHVGKLLRRTLPALVLAAAAVQRIAFSFPRRSLGAR